MNVSGGRIELILPVAGWLSHDSNIKAQLPGLCVVASPRQACDCGGLEGGAMLRALDHSYCFSPCVQEELGTEGRSWAPKTKVEPQSQQNEHLGHAQTLGRGKGPAH